MKTTNERTTSIRDKHPARSARILATGISMASVLGLTSAYAIAAQHSSSALVDDPIATTPEVIQFVEPIVDTPVFTPTQPRPATPVNSVAPAVAKVSPAETPSSTRPIKLKVLKSKVSATKSSGSK